MNFRISRATLCLTLSIAFLSGCSDFMHGKKDKEKNLKIQLVDDSCSKDFKQQLKKITNSEANEAEINSVFECVDKYMNQFQIKVEGEARADVYEAQDLLYVTNRFFKDLELSKDVIKKITHFKKALVGGEAASVTRQELTELREYFQKYVQPETLLLSPHLKVLQMSSDSSPVYGEKEVAAALEQARKSFKLLLSKAHFERTGYGYSDFKELLFGLEFVDSRDQQMIYIVDKTRRLLIGNNELKTNENFAVFIDNAVDAYGLYLRSCRGQVKFEITSLDNVRNVMRFFDRIVDVLNTSYQYKKTGRIATYDLDEVLKLLMEKKIFPFDVQFGTFRDFYKVALKRVFAQETSDFITTKQLETYYKESELFKLQISYLESLDTKKTFTISDIQTSLRLYAEKTSYHAVSTRFKSQERLQIANLWVDMNIDLYKGSPALVRDNKYVLSQTFEHTTFSALDLARSFYIKMLARQLLTGWGNGKTAPIKEASLSKDQMMAFTQEFNQLGIELKLKDPRSKSDGSKAFFEANLFGFTSDGNQSMSMAETFEYMHYLVAEGSGTTRVMQNDLKVLKCELPQLDVFGNHWNSESCFIQNLKKNYHK